MASAPSSLRVCWHLIISHLGDYADFCAGLYALRYVAGVTVSRSGKVGLHGNLPE
jgi:hypothetical protein